MSTLSAVQVTGAWTLVYDAAVSGSFVGAAICLSSDQVIYRVSSSLPAPSDAGVPAFGMIPVALSRTEKLYARAPDGQATIVLDPGMASGGFPIGAFAGNRALTVQTYTESNVKNGSQFAASSYFTGLTAGENIDFIIITGAKKVLIKGQYLAIKNSGDVLLDFYKNPTYTGGANISAGVYNQSDVARLPSTVQLLGCTPTNAATGDYSPNDATKVSVSNVGTKINPTLVALGNSGIGGSTSARAVSEGLEQVLDANSVYLYRRRFVAAAEAQFGYSTWFEGEPDFPL